MRKVLKKTKTCFFEIYGIPKSRLVIVIARLTNGHLSSSIQSFSAFRGIKHMIQVG